MFLPRLVGQAPEMVVDIDIRLTLIGVAFSMKLYPFSYKMTTPIQWDPKNEPIQYASMYMHYIPIVYCQLQVKL
jgi:hypothetical protein